jgi:tetratricopeptide (TPR) repeat protein
MRRMSPLVRATSMRGFGAALAMAVALAGGAALGTAATSTAAMAQQPEVKASRGFARVYQPLADIANSDAGDFAAAKAQLPGAIAAAETADDRYLAGSLTFVLGNKLQEVALQRQGLELMLASGKATPAAAAEINYFLGDWAFEAKDWAKARGHLQAAVAGGYQGANLEGLMAESYFQGGQADQGLAYLESVIDQRSGAGQEVPEGWIRRGLMVAYEARNVEQAGKWSAMLVGRNPTAENWLQTLQVVDALHTLDSQARLDLLRLMALTNSLGDRRNFVNYIEAADPRIMATEVGRVLDAGVRAGVFSSSDQFYADVKRVVDERAPGERADAASYAREARSASSGRPAQNAGELFLALQSFAEAEEMFALALEKGGIDRDAVLTRLGMAQVQQGKLNEARATFGQVSGNRTAVARMWAAYAESRA